MAHINRPCFIWETDAEELKTGSGGDYIDIDSPRAGGRYRITGSATGTIQSLDKNGRARLTTWLVDQRLFGSDLPTVNEAAVDRAHSARSLTVLERRDRLMRYLARRVRHLGEWVKIPGQVTEEAQKNILAMVAWTESLDNSEIYYFINHLRNAEYIESPTPGGQSIRLTPEGYSYLASLDAANVDSSQAFIAMWFDASLDDAYKHGFEQAVNDAGYRPVRIDRVEHINKIDDEIIAAIRRSRFLVADFTCGVVEHEGRAIGVARGGVYFEAGFAQGLNIPVIWTCRKGIIEHVHFDTRQFNHIVWSDPEDVYSQLKNRIEAVIGDGPLKETV